MSGTWTSVTKLCASGIMVISLSGCFGLRAEHMVDNLKTNFPVGSEANALRSELARLQFQHSMEAEDNIRGSSFIPNLPTTDIECYERRPPNLGGLMFACFSEDETGQITWRFFDNQAYW